MKKSLCYLMILIIILGLCGCNDSLNDSNFSETEIEFGSESSNEEDCATTESGDEDSIIDIPIVSYTSQELVCKCVGGYRIRCTVTYSPWVCANDHMDVLNNSWAKICTNHNLPSPDSFGWNINKNSSGFYNVGGKSGQSITGINKFYYMIGTVKFENITEGDWHFTNDQTGTTSVGISLNIKQDGMNGMGYLSHGIWYCGEKKVANDHFVSINPLMTADTHGPTPFLLAFFDDSCPDYPEGRYKDFLKSDLSICSDTNHPLIVKTSMYEQ